MIFPCHWCGKDVEVHYKYGYKYCIGTDCQKLAKAARINNRKSELARLRQQRNNETFLEYLERNEVFILLLTTTVKELYDQFDDTIIFELVWAHMRQEGFRLRNALKIPCKQYLRDHEPDCLKYFKDI